MMYMPLRRTLIVFLSMACLAWGRVAVRPAEPEPVAGGETRTQQIGRWLADLADPRAAVRERAREELMGLSGKELPMLRSAIQEAGTLEPGQVVMLKEIVAQVYLASQPYEKSDRGFLGIVIPSGEVVRRNVRNRAEAPNINVVVESRLPGFPGYRWLRDGDAILEIEERPLPQPLDRISFINAISGMEPGAVVHLKVLRQGKVVGIAARLDARPALRPGEDENGYSVRMQEMTYQRGLEAERHWRENFASLVSASAKDK